jgi:hypothetical protein
VRVHAYVLAADPTWLRTSVLAYYDYVDRIVVSYDSDGRGWTGAPIDVERCLTALREIDRGEKLVFAPGIFRKSGVDVMAADTHQRTVALKLAGEGADWVLQIDSDEVLPSLDALDRALKEATRRGLSAVEWPMKVLYRGLRGGFYLEVVGSSGQPHFDYPGPIAVRPNVRLVDARRTDSDFMRATVIDDTTSLQISVRSEANEHRVPILVPDEAIWHNSWARDPHVVWRKIRSWGHNAGVRSYIYYIVRWLPARYTWRIMRDFHPFARGLWPRLAVSDVTSDRIHPSDKGGAAA